MVIIYHIDLSINTCAEKGLWSAFMVALLYVPAHTYHHYDHAQQKRAQKPAVPQKME